MNYYDNLPKSFWDNFVQFAGLTFQGNPNSGIKRNIKKDELQENVLAKVEEDATVKQKFFEWFRIVERAGHKEFNFFSYEIESEDLLELKTKIEAIELEDTSRPPIMPNFEDGRIFQYTKLTENRYLIKAVQLSKKQIRVEEMDPEPSEDGYFFKAYTVQDFRHVTTYEFSLKESNLCLVVGIDSGVYSGERNKWDLIKDDLELLTNIRPELLIKTEVIQKLSDLIEKSNVITKRQSDIHKEKKQGASYSQDTNPVTRVISRLNHKKTPLSIDSIKSEFSDEDVSSNTVKNAAKINNIELTTIGAELQFYYFLEIIGKYQVVRFTCDARNGRISTMNSDTPWDGLINVLQSFVEIS